MGTKGDGDQLSFIAVKDPTFHKYFMTMCPTYGFIDRANGLLNRGMDFKREYTALISAAWDIDRAYDRFLTDPEADIEKYVNVVGFDSGDPNALKQRDELLKTLAKASKDNNIRKRFLGDMSDKDIIKGINDGTIEF